MNTNKPLELYKEYCSLKDYDENTKTLYLIYDSIKLISNEYSNTNSENMIEIFVIIPLYFIILTINEISKLMMVTYIDPNNILIYQYFYYFLKRAIQFIVNEGDEKYLTKLQFYIVELEEIISIIANMIYIEVIELKFCKLDYELKKNIALRGRNETKSSEYNLFLDNDNDEKSELFKNEDE